MKTINLQLVDGNVLAPVDALTNKYTYDAGVRGDNNVTILQFTIPNDWSFSGVVLYAVAPNGTYDCSTAIAGTISLPVKQALTLWPYVTVRVVATDASGKVMITADCQLAIKDSLQLPDMVSPTQPTILAQLMALIKASGGDMFKVGFCQGKGSSNANQVDNAQYAANAGHASSADTATNATNAANAATANSATSALTAVTQATTDNSTNIATTAFVRNAVNSLSLKPVFTAVTLNSPWAPRVDSFRKYRPVGYTVNALGEVKLQGMITGGAFGSIAFTIDPGLRPAGDIFEGSSGADTQNNLAHGICIHTNGDVEIVPAPSDSSHTVLWFPLDDVSYNLY